MSCGWGLRSWDPIQDGSFICEYVCDIMEKVNEEEDGYIYIYSILHGFIACFNGIMNMSLL